MKNELTRKNGYSDYDFFNEAMHDFFPSFYGLAETTVRNICARISKRLKRSM